MRSLICCVFAMAMTAPAYTQTTPPAAPSVTAGAEFKGLRLDWTQVAAAWYQVEYRAHQTGPFVQLGANFQPTTTSIRFRLPLHLFDWTYARYRVAACNSAGCTRSNEVSVSGLRRDVVGYFKASDPGFNAGFGDDTDISPDGLNFVTAAPGASISGPGGSFAPGGALYVFRRAPNGTWTQRARLTPPIPPFIEGVNEMVVSISADGNTVVLGMPSFFREEFDVQSGEAFVFRFNGTSWVRTRLHAGTRGSYGRWVGINDAGDTVALASGDDIDATTPRRVFIYRLTGGNWQPVRTLGYRANEGCSTGVLSRDGSTIAEQCGQGTGTVRDYVRVHSGPNWTVREEIPLTMAVSSDDGYGNIGLGISGNGNTIAAQIFRNWGPEPNMGPAEVHVFKRDGAWSKVATLTPGAWRADLQESFYGFSIAVSGDGGTIAVGDSWDNGFGTGPRAAPLNPDTKRSGAVYVYRRGRTSWVLMNMVKPNYAVFQEDIFGREVALNHNGQTLIVGHAGEDSSAVGIGGNWADSGRGSSGAVFMY
jgi:hypothetical protein